MSNNSQAVLGEAAFLGRGWAFPPVFHSGGGEVEMVSGAEGIEQSIKTLLLTIPGERVMQETFGCDLRSFVFEELDQRLISTLQRLIKNAVIANEQRIDLDTVDVSRSDSEPFCVIIHIKYTIRATNSRFNMVFPFYLLETASQGL